MCLITPILMHHFNSRRVWSKEEVINIVKGSDLSLGTKILFV